MDEAGEEEEGEGREKGKKAFAGNKKNPRGTAGGRERVTRAKCCFKTFARYSFFLTNYNQDFCRDSPPTI